MSPEIEKLSQSDIYWDSIVSITETGVEEVFDLTVPGPHNFVANDIIVHNSEEQDHGASKGNLADVAPGKSIGGDIFSNREGKLPGKSGRTWREADINYTSGFRNSDRILYSSDWLIYKTTDHYQTFTKIR
nr:barnase-C-DnaB intein-C fusion protein [Transformation Vector pICH13688]